MPPTNSQDPAHPVTPPQSIPLRDLEQAPDSAGLGDAGRRHHRGRSLWSSSSRLTSGHNSGPRFERLGDMSPSPTERVTTRPGGAPKSILQAPSFDDEGGTPLSTVGNPADFQAAVGFAGLHVPDMSLPQAPGVRSPYGSGDFDGISHFGDAGDDHQPYFTPESDRMPLTDPDHMQPVSGAEPSTRDGQRRRGSRLGDDLQDAEVGLSPHNGRTRSRLPSTTGALSKAGSIVRAMSQRVVNLSGDTGLIEMSARREASSIERLRDESGTQYQLPHEADPLATSPNYRADPPTASVGKTMRFFVGAPPQPLWKQDPRKPPNPLKGQSLGIFSAESKIRNKFCDLLVYPLTEPAILLLIVFQTVLLTVDSSQNVYTHPRPAQWGHSVSDYALLVLFVIFTLEIIARIIVSGFILNAPEHSTVNRERGFKAIALDKYRAVFEPQRKSSIRMPPTSTSFNAPNVIRSFTAVQGEAVQTVQEAQRLQLARRAFLRHTFNRLDFVAVVSFWIAFVLGITGVEHGYHLYVFRMLSCLRILRLLALTNGTIIILRSLKKATPLLINVSFLIGFFWLLFAIIGVQSFKGSFDRQCVWIDPADPFNQSGTAYTNVLQYCGGQLNNATGTHEPWKTGPLDALEPGADYAKGFLCPRGSYCLQLAPDQLPYNGTVSFDNIFQSLELVFVIMTGNTFTDLMYYATNSDYLAAALFFAGGTMIMTLWLLNLLIAVITSSFQVIREEGKASTFAAHVKTSLPAEVPESPRRVSKMKGLYNKTYWFWIMAITYDLVCQSFRSAYMSPARGNFIDNSELVVAFILLVEIILRFVVDWRGFFQNKKNWFDLGLAIITTIILIPPIQNSGQPYAWLTVFQILRIYRVIIAVPVTRKLITLVLGNSSGVGNLMLFVFLITFLFSIFAVQLFRGELTPYDPYGNVIHVTFFTLYNTFLGMYQILSSENWTINLYNITAFDTARNTAWIGAVFFIGWFILANFILVNMFIAIIQENFDVSEDEKRMHQVKAFLSRKELGSSSSNPSLTAIFRLGRSRTRDPLDYGHTTMEMLLKDAVVRDFLDDEVGHSQQAVATAETMPTHEVPAISPGPFSSLWGKFMSRIWNREPNPFYSNIQFSAGADESTDARTMAKEAVSATSQRKRAQREFLARHPNYNNALFVFKPNNPIRRFCQRIVGPGRGSERFDGVEPNRALWYAFSAFIYVVIVAMVVLACITTPLYQREYFDKYTFDVKNWFVWADIAFAIIFTIEAAVKIIADGFFWTPNAYFRTSWGFIDGIVLITFWINVITAVLNDGAVSRAVGAFKALRALRLLNMSNSARETFHSLIVGGWKIFSAALVSLSLLIPFAIYGVNLFNGQMLICNDNTGDIHNLTSDCFGEWNSTPFSNNWNLLAPRTVKNPYYNFDNFGSSLFILFQIVSEEGWVDVMWSAESITGRGLQPEYFASQSNAIFFIIFNLMGTVFVLTLFISVFMRNYTEQTGVAFLTSDQRSWLELRKVLRQVSPSKRPSNTDGQKQKWKDWCYKRAVRKHGKWQRAMTVVLVLHLILLLVESYPEPGWWDLTRLYIFLAFTVFYMANITVQIIGLSWARFSRNSWGLYSIFAIFGTFATTILLLANLKSQILIQLHKLFLVLIVFLLIPRNDALDQLFKTAATSLTNIGNLLATWFILFLVFAIAMTQTFGLTRFGFQETNNLNFRTVPKALILLFRMSVGEGWNQIMEDYATILPPRCVSDDNFLKSDCGSTSWARVLFISWNILSMYIFTNLFVSLIYESFSYVYQRSKGLERVTKEEIRRFKQAWATLDPEGTGFISKEAFPRLLSELSGVFEMRIYSHENSVRRILEDVQAQPTKGPIATTNGASTVNLKALDNRLAKINRREVQKARARYNLFFEEVMVSADVDRGISFSTVLIMLAHYNVISDNKSLKLEEFLRRRARLQRVEEEVRRKIVLSFFDTMYWSRRFRKHMERKRSGRMTDIPQLGPEVYVDDEGDITKQATPSKSLLLSPLDVSDASGSSIIDGSDGVRRRRGTDASISGSRPLSPSSPRVSPQLSPHRATNSTSRFDGVELGGGGSGGYGSPVSAENVLEMLDNSAWGESIKRSFTIRRPSR